MRITGQVIDMRVIVEGRRYENCCPVLNYIGRLGECKSLKGFIEGAALVLETCGRLRHVLKLHCNKSNQYTV